MEEWWNEFMQGLGGTSASGLLGGLAGGGLVYKGYSDLDKLKGDAMGLAKEEIADKIDTGFEPFTITGAGGNVTTDDLGNVTFSGDQSADLIYDNNMSSALNRPNRYRDLADQMRPMFSGENLSIADAASYADLGTAGQNFVTQGSSMLEGLGGSMADREAGVYDRIRAVQRPEEERQRLALEERLAAQGRSGLRTAMYGGAPEQLALAKAQEEAKNSAALAAIGQAQQEQIQQYNLGAGLFGLGAQGQSQQLGLANQGLQNILGGQQGMMGLAGFSPQLQQMYLQNAFLPQAQQLNMYQAGLAGSAFGDVARRQQQQLATEALTAGLNMKLAAGLGQGNIVGNLGSGLLAAAFGAGGNREGGLTLANLFPGLFGGGDDTGNTGGGSGATGGTGSTGDTLSTGSPPANTGNVIGYNYLTGEPIYG